MRGFSDHEQVNGMIILSSPLPDRTSKLADDPEATKREMRMIQRESQKVGRLEGRKVLGVLVTLK